MDLNKVSEIFINSFKGININEEVSIKNKDNINEVFIHYHGFIEYLNDTITLTLSFLNESNSDTGTLSIALIGYFPEVNNVAVPIINGFNSSHDFKFISDEIGKLLCLFEFQKIKLDNIKELIDNTFKKIFSNDVRLFFKEMNSSNNLYDCLMD